MDSGVFFTRKVGSLPKNLSIEPPMAWGQLAIDKPHLAYLIIGGFTTLFMLCSLVVKERLYIGEATVATICGVIFGPHAADLFSPSSWGNTDKITLECSRIVLVVQCFAVGVELPKAYMERHWRSVTFLLVPVMACGWLLTSLFIWRMVEPLSWFESLAIAACVTATDPVLASSVVGKGKFAKRVPKHLRDLLSAESGCNDGMAFPFIYLSIYLIRYENNANAVAFHWICFIILYECVFGAVYGFTVGYIGRHAIKFADRRGYIDRESFLVFYFVLALFCAGSGSLLGLDDLLVGFAAGVGFSNDGWFSEKTEESHVSNVIDLLLNLAYFVFLGAIIPWGQYNNAALGLTPWRLAIIAIMVVLFRRIPIMLVLKPVIPDIKNWREALFAGHFGPIGVGAIFAAILTRAELESDSTEPLALLPQPGAQNYLLVQVIWPIVTFLVIASILVHGSSIAVFTLGKRINTLTLTMSYTQANEPSWMNRLPRISSTSRSMSKSKADYESTASLEERLPTYPPGTLLPIGIPGNLLRRQKEEDNSSKSNSRASSLRPNRRKKWDSGIGPGGPISQSAIMPQRRSDPASPVDSPLETPRGRGVRSFGRDEHHASESPQMQEGKRKESQDNTMEVFVEGDHIIIEDEEGNVLSDDGLARELPEEQQQDILDAMERARQEGSREFVGDREHPHISAGGETVESTTANELEPVQRPHQSLKKKIGVWGWKDKEATPRVPERHRGPAHAYQYGHTIILEDQDGEVIEKYDIPTSEKKRRHPERAFGSVDSGPIRERLSRLRQMSTWVSGQGAETMLGNGQDPEGAADPVAGEGVKQYGKDMQAEEEDDGTRFIISDGQRMSKADFIRKIQSIDPKARGELIDESDGPEGIKRAARASAEEHGSAAKRSTTVKKPELNPTRADLAPQPTSATGVTRVESNTKNILVYPVSDAISRYSAGTETAAQRRRRIAHRPSEDVEANDSFPVSQSASSGLPSTTLHRQESAMAGAAETDAERRRRLAALGEGDVGEGAARESDSDDDGRERLPRRGHRPVEEIRTDIKSPGIRFADAPAVSRERVQGAEKTGRFARRRGA